MRPAWSKPFQRRDCLDGGLAGAGKEPCQAQGADSIGQMERIRGADLFIELVQGLPPPIFPPEGSKVNREDVEVGQVHRNTLRTRVNDSRTCLSARRLM